MITNDTHENGFRQLDPDSIIDAIEATGRRCTGQLLALNSYENRVYQIGLDDGPAIIAKFYRPHRWSEAQILEEHRFCDQLETDEIPVVAPLKDQDGNSLYRHNNSLYALYPQRGGHAPELDRPEHLQQFGRFMARIHNQGAQQAFDQRPNIEPQTFGHQARATVLASGQLPAHLEPAYASVSEDLLSVIDQRWAETPHQTLRLHGDAHPGNILWRETQFHIVDLDDARNGPAIQDLWMFLSGPPHEQNAALQHVLRGYHEFRTLDLSELKLVEALRALRQLHHVAWIAKRWQDPAFPLAFPYFQDNAFWEQHVLALREQRAALDEQPLQWMG